MPYLDMLEEICEQYRRDVMEMDKTLRPGSGMLGLGPRPGDAPCHEKFDRAVAALLRTPPEDTADAAAVSRALLLREDGPAWPEHAKWMLIAVQRHGMALYRRLPPETAAALLDRYEKLYPRMRRLPVQKEIMRALKEAAGK